MKSRKQRKLEVKRNGVSFVPQYNGTGVLTYEEFYGVGNERFNNKFVQFNKEKEDVIESVVEDTNEIEVVAAELVKETPKSKRKDGKLKNKLKKLFNK